VIDSQNWYEAKSGLYYSGLWGLAFGDPASERASTLSDGSASLRATDADDPLAKATRLGTDYKDRHVHARLHDDQIDPVVFQDRPHVPPRRGRRPEQVFLRLGVEKAAHRVEFSEVNGENVHGVAQLKTPPPCGLFVLIYSRATTPLTNISCHRVRRMTLR
jgi:hypothetical protein